MTDGWTDRQTDAHVKCYVSTTIVGRQKQIVCLCSIKSVWKGAVTNIID